MELLINWKRKTSWQKIDIFVCWYFINQEKIIMNLLTVFMAAQGGGDYSFLIMMVAIFAIMYFFMIRPQNKKQKEIANFRK